MHFRPEPLQKNDPEFDAALCSKMQEQARLQSDVMLAGNFFTNAMILEELDGIFTDDEGEWTYTFGGQSWHPNVSASIVVPDTGVYGDAETDYPGNPTKYELFLDAYCRSPYLLGKTHQKLIDAVGLFKRRLIKTCTHIAIDTAYRYELSGPWPGTIKRSAEWSIVGILPDRPEEDDLILKAKKFDPICNPSPLGSYLVFGHEMEFASTALSLDHREQERGFAIYFDKRRINKILVGLGWSAIGADI